MTLATPANNKATVLEAFDALFNKRDYEAAERFWSPDYIQHSAHIGPGRDGLLALTKGLPDTLRYENHLALAEGDFVILHGRFSVTDCPGIGSWRTSYAWKTAFWSNTGMSLRTR